MNKPVGGRGQKAPYETRVMRVPEPIADIVQSLIDGYRNQVLDNNSNGNSSNEAVKILTLNELIVLAKSVLRSKKSAKHSFILLTRRLFPNCKIYDDIL